MKLIDADALKELFPDNGEGSWTYNATVKAYIDAQPTIQPDTTTHDSIPVETGKNDGDRTSGDCISRQQAIDALLGITAMRNTIPLDSAIFNIKKLPSVQPDIIHCKDCEYLCNEDGLRGMCWHINGFGTDIKDKYNSFCSWAERRTDE